MTTRYGYLGVVLAAVGLAIGLIGLILQGSILALVVGVFAVGSGASCAALDRRSASARWAQGLMEDELLAARSRTEPVVTRDAAAPPPRVQPEPEPEPVPQEPAMIDDRLLPPPRVSGPTSDAEPASFIEHAAESAESLVDPLTGLFSEGFYRVALDGRIAAARRHLRPVAMVLIEVVKGLPGEPEPVPATVVGEVIKGTLREADTACRLNNGHFALLLEDTPENGAIWTVERIRRKLLTDHDGFTVWAGVACYPAHAFGTAELIDAAANALVAAREWRQDRIEVATAAD